MKQGYLKTAFVLHFQESYGCVFNPNTASCALFEVCSLDYDVTFHRFPAKEILIFIEITLNNSHEGLYMRFWNFLLYCPLFKIMFVHSLAGFGHFFQYMNFQILVFVMQRATLLLFIMKKRRGM